MALFGREKEQTPLDGVDTVLRHADRAMYDAKMQGGNRLVQARPQEYPDIA